jgi:hypothetical protein
MRGECRQQKSEGQIVWGLFLKGRLESLREKWALKDDSIGSAGDGWV